MVSTRSTWQRVVPDDEDCSNWIKDNMVDLEAAIEWIADHYAPDEVYHPETLADSLEECGFKVTRRTT